MIPNSLREVGCHKPRRPVPETLMSAITLVSTSVIALGQRHHDRNRCRQRGHSTQKKGSNHVIDLKPGDSFEILNVVVDNMATHLKVQTIMVKGKSKHKN